MATTAWHAGNGCPQRRYWLQGMQQGSTHEGGSSGLVLLGSVLTTKERGGQHTERSTPAASSRWSWERRDGAGRLPGTRWGASRAQGVGAEGRRTGDFTQSIRT